MKDGEARCSLRRIWQSAVQPSARGCHLQRISVKTMPVGEMDDRYAEFLITVGGMCDAAQRAGLGVVVKTQTGTQIAGVPAIRGADADDELDDTGYARTFRIDDALVNLDEVVSCTIQAPAEPDWSRRGLRRVHPAKPA